MILQALVEHYEKLSERNEIAPPGWSAVKVSYALCLGPNGELQQVVCIKTEQPKGKKMVLAPQMLQLPAPVKRSSGVAANFLCDNSSYMLGIDNKNKPARAKECFNACRELHERLLSKVDTPAAKAIQSFFQAWEPERAAEHPALADNLDDLLSGVNFVFRVDGCYAQDDYQIQQAWNQNYLSAGDGPEMVCLVTGEKGPVESVHPSIKNVAGAQSSGAALVSFNAPAFCSYGKEQNLNAPVSQYATFAYTTALNHLLSDREHVCHIGDSTVVYWAQSGASAYQDLMGSFCFGQDSTYNENDLFGLVLHLCQGDSVDFEEEHLNPEMKFYVLGLSPNAARLSVRFFLCNTLGKFLQNVMEHHERLEIVLPSYDKFTTIPLWALLAETVNQKSHDKSPTPNLAGDTLRAVLNNAPYPATLLNGTRLRIRAERNITRGRAAIIKAYYLKNTSPDIPNPEEVLTVSLNPSSTSVPYTLGRLFSVLEAIQSTANPGLNTTIKDRYFNAASATPGHIFPTLLNLAQKHLKKIGGGLAVNYDKQITELLGKLDDSYPAHLSIPQQGVFQLGYYHQTQARYEGKKNKEET